MPTAASPLPRFLPPLICGRENKAIIVRWLWNYPEKWVYCIKNCLFIVYNAHLVKLGNICYNVFGGVPPNDYMKKFIKENDSHERLCRTRNRVC